MNVATVCGELRVQVEAASCMIQGIKCDLVASMQTSREQIEAVEAAVQRANDNTELNRRCKEGFRKKADHNG